MLDFLFGFNARLARLQFLMATIALTIVMLAAGVALASQGYIHAPRGSQVSLSALGWPALLAVLLFVFGTIALQSMRIRDIGWDPVCVIPAWITVLIVDAIVAAKMPSLALGPGHYGTVVSSIVHLVMTGILFLWPSSDA